jgi:aerotaxis receptor
MVPIYTLNTRIIIRKRIALMRVNLPVTDQERAFPANQRLISTTDLDSRITYCNDAFVAISGFTAA